MVQLRRYVIPREGVESYECWSLIQLAFASVIPKEGVERFYHVVALQADGYRSDPERGS